IAGGIGITPLMSMLRHMRDTRAERRVLLLFANRTEEDIAFRDELAAMEAGAQPQLKAVHIFDKPDDDWRGEKGRLDAPMIERLCGGDLPQRAFYVCAPPALMDVVIKCLRTHGVPAKNIHFERFNL
ncbi:MAG: oxidoreductase, partial [Chthoniobacteraceae bacterium]